ncbi:6656_t:CDS:2, partial [Funneliformis geosporum]
NYPQTNEASNLVSVTEYNDENISLTSFLPSHAQQALPRLPIFETVAVIPQHQNGKGANKSVHSFNNLCHDFKSHDSFPRFVPRNSSSTNRHSMYCGDLPSNLHHQINRSNGSNKPPKMRRRAASFGESSIHGRTDSVQISETLIENNSIENPQSNNNSNLINSQSQPNNRAFFRHTIILNNNASGSSTDLRKSMYKEPSFTKKLRKVFSLSNIRQDDHNSNSTTSSAANSRSSSPVFNNRFSSLRGKKNHLYNLNDNDDGNSSSNNNEKDDDTSVSSTSSNGDNILATTKDLNNNNKSRRRTFDFQSLFSKNDKKRNQKDRHKKQQQRHRSHLEQSISSSSVQQNHDNDDSLNELKGNGDNNKGKQPNGNEIENGNKQASDDSGKREGFYINLLIDLRYKILLIQNNGNNYKAPIPPRISSLQSLNDQQVSSNKVHQNSTSPLQNPFRVKKSENQGEEKNNSPVSSSLQSSSRGIQRPSSLPATAKNQEPSFTSPTPRRLSVPVPLSILNSNASRSDPSLVVVRDIDVPPAPSTPSAKKLQFSSSILVHETWTRDDYDRRGDQSTCNKLTSILAQRIKQELNEYKISEMQVHEDSKHNTHFFS